MASMIAAGLTTEPEPVRLPDLYEVIEGKIVTTPSMSLFSVKVAGRLHRHLDEFVEQHQLGRAFVEGLFRLESLNRSRRPDVMFFSYARWPQDSIEDPVQDEAPVVPDLAVEVVSPSDVADDLMEKIEEYFQVGVRLVWVIYPRFGVVHIYDSFHQVRCIGREGELDGGDVLPGFRLSLASLLPNLRPRSDSP